ncbi:MAG: endo alpha-1,4 polygalactosaminidase [Rhodospirillales bacterium]|nr:endo alpha-1,4 polygalactosaminidase [Rhodospirillales bacterium]
MGYIRFASLLVIAILLVPDMLGAQQSGQVRTQGRILTQEQGIGPARPAGGILDYREEMRRFVQSISKFARQYRRDFSVLPINGLDLLVKIDPTDPEIQHPARTYMRSINGIVQEGLFYGVPEFGKPTDEKRVERLLPLAKMAMENGIKVLVMDYAKTPKTVDAGRRLAAKHGFTFFGAPAIGSELTTVPRFPRRPYGESGNSVLSLKSINNFLVIRDSSGFGRMEEFALKMHENNFDLVVVDVLHAVGEALSRRAVETLKFKKLGAKRLVFAYVDIGSAASYSYFWKDHWREGSPRWISAPVPGDPDRYFVQYWQPEWRQLITGDTNSYIYGVIRQGFDGVILDGMENFRYFEGGLEALAQQ